MAELPWSRRSEDRTRSRAKMASRIHSSTSTPSLVSSFHLTRRNSPPKSSARRVTSPSNSTSSGLPTRLALRLQWTPTSHKTTEMALPGLACASTRMETCKLTSAASTPTSMPFGVVSGKPRGSSTPKETSSRVQSRSTITTLRTVTSISLCRKNSRRSLWRMQMLKVSLL